MSRHQSHNVSKLDAFIALAIVLLAAPPAAFAYIDPGSGALVLQAIVAGVMGAVFFFRNNLRKPIDWLRSKFRKQELPAPPEETTGKPDGTE